MGTIPQLKQLINNGIEVGLDKFVAKYENDMTKYADKAEDQYYSDYSSWYDPYRRYDIKNMDRVSSLVFSRGCSVKIEFSQDNMNGGHGFAPLHNDPGQVFTWGFETGNHGWYVSGIPVRTYWEIYFKSLESRAKSWATKYVISGLHSVGL